MFIVKFFLTKSSLHDRCHRNNFSSKRNFYAVRTIEKQLFVFDCFNFEIKVMKMFCKLPFLTIIFIGIVIFENKTPLSFAMDVSTKQTDVEQVEVASTLKIINQENEADLAEEQINKKRRKSSGPGRTVRFNPNKRKSSGRSFGAPRSTFDNSKIKSGIHF